EDRASLDQRLLFPRRFWLQRPSQSLRAPIHNEPARPPHARSGAEAQQQQSVSQRSTVRLLAHPISSPDSDRFFLCTAYSKPPHSYSAKTPGLGILFRRTNR